MFQGQSRKFEKNCADSSVHSLRLLDVLLSVKQSIHLRARTHEQSGMRSPSVWWRWQQYRLAEVSLQAHLYCNAIIYKFGTLFSIAAQLFL